MDSRGNIFRLPCPAHRSRARMIPKERRSNKPTVHVWVSERAPGAIREIKEENNDSKALHEPVRGVSHPFAEHDLAVHSFVSVCHAREVAACVAGTIWKPCKRMKLPIKSTYDPGRTATLPRARRSVQIIAACVQSQSHQSISEFLSFRLFLDS